MNPIPEYRNLCELFQWRKMRKQNLWSVKAFRRRNLRRQWSSGACFDNQRYMKSLYRETDRNRRKASLYENRYEENTWAFELFEFCFVVRRKLFATFKRKRLLGLWLLVYTKERRKLSGVQKKWRAWRRMGLDEKNRSVWLVNYSERRE